MFYSSFRHLSVTVCQLPSSPSTSSLRSKCMSFRAISVNARQHLVVASSILALLSNLAGPLPASAENPHRGGTVTPIKHVIVIIGENRTFDHVFATYEPRDGQSVSNLLSKGIVNE